MEFAVDVVGVKKEGRRELRIWQLFLYRIAILISNPLNALYLIEDGLRTSHSNVMNYQKKKVFPSPSRLDKLIFFPKSSPGSYSCHKLAGKICLFLSYHRRSTTLVIVGSFSAPSSSSSLGRASGSSVAGAGGGWFE